MHNLEPGETPSYGLEPGETPSNSASHQAPNYVQRSLANDEIMSKNQFGGTATQPQCNHNFCQFNNDQYCNTCFTKG